MSRFGFWAIAFGVVAGGALTALGAPASDSDFRADVAAWPHAESVGCPAGEVADDEETGFRCVPQCPSGMMVDAQTHMCVAAPGVPPALPEVQLVPIPQI
jgi:hypothetical protein